MAIIITLMLIPSKARIPDNKKTFCLGDMDDFD
jgi:hypothetical protein